jgi:hypothetical protein
MAPWPRYSTQVHARLSTRPLRTEPVERRGSWQRSLNGRNRCIGHEELWHEARGTWGRAGNAHAEARWLSRRRGVRAARVAVATRRVRRASLVAATGTRGGDTGIRRGGDRCRGRLGGCARLHRIIARAKGRDGNGERYRGDERESDVRRPRCPHVRVIASTSGGWLLSATPDHLRRRFLRV